MMIKQIAVVCIGAFLLNSCSQYNSKDQTGKVINCAIAQNKLQLEAMGGEVKNIRTISPEGKSVYITFDDWTSGFFPASMWYMYELTGDSYWEDIARQQCANIEEAKNLDWHHDVGFMIGCSYGNGLRLTGDEHYKDVVVTAANSLMSRFRKQAGVIQSWNVDADWGWIGKMGWSMPVIIDNMMNLELLFMAEELTGDKHYREVAISHADVTLREHFRKDFSCYHVIDYDASTGAVRSRQTAQGYSDESIWSRGQAWAIYGYTVMYRYTKDKKYLDQAYKTFEMMKNHPSLPEDLIPYWDMSAPGIPNEPRDASSAAIIASALYEMSEYFPSDHYFKDYADRIYESLISDEYLAKVGENGFFMLKHSVGSIPHNSDVDVPLNYADYYLLEATLRKRALDSKLINNN